MFLHQPQRLALDLALAAPIVELAVEALAVFLAIFVIIAVERFDLAAAPAAIIILVRSARPARSGADPFAVLEAGATVARIAADAAGIAALALILAPAAPVAALALAAVIAIAARAAEKGAALAGGPFLLADPSACPPR